MYYFRQKRDVNAEWNLQKQVQVEFYVIIPAEFNFNPQKDIVHIMIGEDFLGGWKSDKWKMKNMK